MRPAAAKEGFNDEHAPLVRAEAADLLVREASLPERLSCDPAERDNPDFVLPSAANGSCPPPLPRDAVGSPQLEAVVFVLCVRLCGLEVRSDGRFEPDRPISRAEWALALGDLADLPAHSRTAARLRALRWVVAMEPDPVGLRGGRGCVGKESSSSKPCKFDVGHRICKVRYPP